MGTNLMRYADFGLGTSNPGFRGGAGKSLFLNFSGFVPHVYRISKKRDTYTLHLTEWYFTCIEILFLSQHSEGLRVSEATRFQWNEVEKMLNMPTVQTSPGRSEDEGIWNEVFASEANPGILRTWTRQR